MGSKRKGMSLDDKRQKMLDLFHEKKDFFQLKEVEKMASHEKGIVLQSVKDVVKSLQDDGLLQSDKVGSSVYFWSLPSQVTVERKRKLVDLEENLERMKGKAEETHSNAKRAKMDQGNSDERAELMNELEELIKLKEQLMKENQEAKECDAIQYRKDEEYIEFLDEGIERWIDNIGMCRDYMRDNFGMDEAAMNERFGLNEDDIYE